jgi:hypothetical protein
MIGSKGQSLYKPAALGATLQSSVYGQTIPVIFGRTKSAMYLIWAANLRKGVAGVAGDQGKKSAKAGAPDYNQNVDFLIAHNPIVAALQAWVNQNAFYPLNFPKHTGSISWTASSLTIGDSNFYAVIGVTVTSSYAVTFNDYGSAPISLSGSWEIPLWNACYAAPDPGLAGTDRYAKSYYSWQPSMGNVIRFPEDDSFLSAGSRTVNVYYAAKDPEDGKVYSKAVGTSGLPLAVLRLTFEPVLGNGPEFQGNDNFTGQPLSNQQILYPHYAGLGSQDYDVGSAQTPPDVRFEFLGTYPLYSTGDADFADMIEDIFKMGWSQAALGLAYNYAQIQRGLGCFDWPGAAQNSTFNNTSPGTTAFPYYRPNTANNILVTIANAGFTVSGGPTLATFGAGVISDTAGNGYIAALPSGLNGQVWYVANCAQATSNVVTISGSNYSSQNTVLEIAGAEVQDGTGSHSTTGRTVEITTTNIIGTPAYLLAVVDYGPNGITAPMPEQPHWTKLMDYANGARNFIAYYQIVYRASTYSFTADLTPSGASPKIVTLLAFKCTQPPSYPRALGNILDSATLDLCRQQCRANGLWGSLVMDSQQKASDWLADLYTAMNAAPVWSGFTLKSIPYSEVSAVGNGAIYIAPTASGPVANLTESDFIGDTTQPLVSVERKAQVDVPNLLQIQHPARVAEYDQVVVSQPETGAIAIYGPRKDSPKTMNMVQDPAVARMLLGVMVRRQNYLRNTYKFTLNAKWKLLEPMDLITLPQSATMPTINGQPATAATIPVRLTSIAEDEKFQLDCQAEPFIYGCCAPSDSFSLPSVPATTQPQPYTPTVGASPGSVNAPIIFEPVPRLYGATNQPWLWLVVSATATVYGGCNVFLSTDGGASYNQVGQINDSAITGVSTADWPAAADPDTTNDLALNLSESNGTLLSYQTSDEDNFLYPCYVAGGNSSIPYELMTYSVATLTATNQYTLKATAGNHLRRAVFGAPGTAGVDHPSGSRWAWLGALGTATQSGILKLPMDPSWIGVVLHFKFCSFNNYLGANQSLTDATDYTYTPTGSVGSVNPGGAPSQLFQVNGT